mgnify:FL=1
MNQQLTQAEIDALLQGGDNTKTEPEVDDYLTAIEQDAIGEIGNIAMGAAATNLSLLISQKVQITTPSVSMITLSKQKEEYERPFVSVQVNFHEGVEGSNVLIIQDRDAAVISQLMMGFDGEVEEHPQLGELELSALSEAMNQMMGAAATAMSTMLEQRILISAPETNLVAQAQETLNIMPIGEEELLVKVAFRINIDGSLDSTIMQLMPLPLAKQMVAMLMGEQQPQEVENPMPVELPIAAEQNIPPAPLLQETQGIPTVQPAQFMPLRQRPEGGGQKMDLIMDVPLEVTVELGRARMRIREILNLSGGSVVELDKLAGEPVDVLVNGQLIAKGEVVVIDENFGIKITDLVREEKQAAK